MTDTEKQRLIPFAQQSFCCPVVFIDFSLIIAPSALHLNCVAAALEGQNGLGVFDQPELLPVSHVTFACVPRHLFQASNFLCTYVELMDIADSPVLFQLQQQNEQGFCRCSLIRKLKIRSWGLHSRSQQHSGWHNASRQGYTTELEQQCQHCDIMILDSPSGQSSGY